MGCGVGPYSPSPLTFLTFLVSSFFRFLEGGQARFLAVGRVGFDSTLTVVACSSLGDDGVGIGIGEDVKCGEVMRTAVFECGFLV